MLYAGGFFLLITVGQNEKIFVLYFFNAGYLFMAVLNYLHLDTNYKLIFK